MSLEVFKNEKKLILHYETSDFYPTTNVSWIFQEFETEKTCLLGNKCFELKKEYLDSYDNEKYSFVDFSIADYVSIEGQNYYKIKKNILQINFDLYFEENCNIEIHSFVTERKTSIFKIINEINIGDSLFVGGTKEDAITEQEYLRILKALPNSYEHRLYDQARVEYILKNYFCTKKDIETQFAKYMKDKNLKETDLSHLHFEDFDVHRYKFLLKQLKNMLDDPQKYENDWQDEILKFIRILFPKYVICVKEAVVRKGTVSKKNKKIDILLGDYDGNIDIIEIKKPYGIDLLNKNLYRENYIPTKALSGAIMQAEKYIYYLTKGGITVEQDLNKQFRNQKPSDYSFKVVNPKSIIIMGRTNNYTEPQKEDLEIIRRKYKNITDIISYDDLLQRLETTIAMLEKREQTEITNNV